MGRGPKASSGERGGGAGARPPGARRPRKPGPRSRRPAIAREDERRPDAALARIREILRRAVVELDAGSLVRPGGRHAALAPAAREPAAVVLGLAEASVESRDDDLALRALALLGDVPELATRVRTAAVVATTLIDGGLASSREVADAVELTLVRLPSDEGCLAAKAEALAAAGAALARRGDPARGARLAGLAGTLAARAGEGRLAALLPLVDAVAGREAAIDAVLERADQAFVSALGYMLSTPAEAQLGRALAALRPGPALFAATDARDLTEAVHLALVGHDVHVVEPWTAERFGVVEQLRAAVGEPLDPAALAGALRDAGREIVSLVPQLDRRERTSGLARFDRLDLGILQPLARGPLPGESASSWQARAQSVVEELAGWIADRHLEVERAMAAVERELTAGAARGGTSAPGFSEDDDDEGRRAAAEVGRAGDAALREALAGPVRPLAGADVARLVTEPGRGASALLVASVLDGPPAGPVTGASPEVRLGRALAARLDSASPPPPERAADVLGRLPAAAVRAVAADLEADPARGARILRRLVVARRCELACYGATVSTFADWLLAAARASDLDTTGDEEAVRRELEDVGPPPARAPGAAAVSRPPVLVRGRTLVYPAADGLLAVKVQREGEPVAALEREGRWMRYARRHAAASVVPEPAGLFPAAGLREEHLAAIEEAGVRVAEEPWALSYRLAAADSDLFTYVGDAEAEARRAGLTAAAADAFAWLRRGVVHGALTAKSHGAGAAGARAYEWMVDVCTVRDQRRGMGRLEALELACRWPNVRATGVADLAELALAGDLLDSLAGRADRGNATPDPLPSILREGTAVARRLVVARGIGDALLDLTLLAADAYARRGLLAGALSPGRATAPELASELRALWLHAIRCWGASPATSALVEAAVDFERMARQLAYFLDPDTYVPDFEATLTRIPGVAPTRDTAASAALATRLRGALYEPGLELDIDLSIHPQGFRQSARPGEARGFAEDGRHHDLGVFNGPWPLLELERGLYLVSGLLLVTAGPEPMAPAARSS